MRTLGPLALAALLAMAQGLPAAAADKVVVGSKNFAESRLLAEIFAQLLEARTELQVERRLGLAGTQVCFEALRTGAIDLYPEYTGTGLVSILDEEATGDARETLNRVRSEFLARWDLAWLAPLGFENAYALGVPRKLAEAHGLETISDLVPLAGKLRGGFGYEFLERPDGLLGLAKTYGLELGEVRGLQQALKYQAVAEGDLDVLDVYTTDGRLLVYDLAVLKDDRGFFPPYEAAALVRGESLERHPEVGAVLGLLSGAFDDATLQRLNLRLQEGGEEEAVVARDALRELGFLSAAGPEESRVPRKVGLGAYLWRHRARIARHTLEHLRLTALALALACLVAIPLGLFLVGRPRLAEPVIRSVGVTQTLPSMALLAFMIPLLGIGVRPAVVALWIYAIFPILRNTTTGVRDADPMAVESATALGMTPAQVLLEVRLPLAAPVVLAGVRTAAVITVGTATLAAFIGAGVFFLMIR
ncbi:MAG: ABC transporter permease subunit, partial [Acidobacteria bacterium]|nr:ABC transporter permease subunit [Acidobacteriota bacterium]